jgi:hypothetical protein
VQIMRNICGIKYSASYINCLKLLRSCGVVLFKAVVSVHSLKIGTIGNTIIRRTISDYGIVIITKS